ncbi:uncharacterized protein [Rutidosis leptorrhynchoides]|uniref:uncharacterized protein n=1 Tax=Rutidosis leptorrhynchoides TaxID=125765 RepID=UPI003A99AC88
MQKKTSHQLLLLEKAYAAESNPNKFRIEKLSKDSGLTYKQVQDWFYRQRVVKPKEELHRQQSKSGSSSGPESKPRLSNEPLDAENILGEIGSHVDSLRAKFKERMQATNEKERIAKRSRHELSSESDSGPCNEPLGKVGHGEDADGSVKNKMIEMLIEKNQRDEAKCESVLEEFKRLEKSIADRKKLIDDIKKVI